MKILLTASGYPPEIAGETDLEVQALSRALASGGHTVVVVAGTLAAGPTANVSSATDGDVIVHRFQRADLHVDHWQKSRSSAVARLFRELVRSVRPDVVHVHHWRRLTRDLVHCAAIEGVVAVVTLHDHWTNCLIRSRVRPDSRAACEAVLGANPCLACAQLVPPKTPWVPIEAQHMAFAERRSELARELELARAVIVPSRAHADALKRFGPTLGAHVELTVLAPFGAGGRAVEDPSAIAAWIGIYSRARGSGAPSTGAPIANDWYSLRMREFAEADWDLKLSRCTRRELGFREA